MEKVPKFPEFPAMKSRMKQTSGSPPSMPLTTGSPPKQLYPSISAAYWLPAPSPTPYLVPGNCYVIYLLYRKCTCY